jgi:hypothetical protein
MEGELMATQVNAVHQLTRVSLTIGPNWQNQFSPKPQMPNVQPLNALLIYKVAEIGNIESSVERCLNSFDEAPRVSSNLPNLPTTSAFKHPSYRSLA